jgi:hypothetical protein
MDTRSNPLAFCDDGGIRFAYEVLQAAERLWPGSTRVAKLIAQHDAWLKKKQTSGRSWYDTITDTLDETWKGGGSDADKGIYGNAGDDAA